MDGRSSMDAVRQARTEKGWTQSELARAAGVSRATVARIEGGERVAMASLVAVAEAVGLKVSVSVERMQVGGN